MPTLTPSARLTSFNAQNLLLEFASVRHAQLDGIYVSLTSGDPSVWAGVIFVRKGPYAPAILRFHISFPPGYPSIPPLVTFLTDLFHPLLTPLTTYTYTTGGNHADTVSASDEERLPPGVFSLRHGFPSMFGRARKRESDSRDVSGSTITSPTRDATPATELQGSDKHPRVGRQVCVAEILNYIKTTFSDETVLDSIPLEAAANPGAFHAWRSHRAETRPQSPDPNRPVEGEMTAPASSGRARRPGEWNWEGVWVERVKKGIRASLSESTLYAGGPGEIQFLNMDEENLSRVRKEIEASASAIAIQ